MSRRKVHAKEMMPPKVLFNRHMLSGCRCAHGSHMPFSGFFRDIRDQLLGRATISIRGVLLLGAWHMLHLATSMGACTKQCGA